MTRYGIRLPDGHLVTDPEWRSPADVMRGAHGQGITRVRGELVVIPEPDTETEHAAGGES